MISEILLQSFGDFHKYVMTNDRRIDIYRGVRQTSYELIPSIGRPELELKETTKKEERRIFNYFKDRAIPHLKAMGFVAQDDWEWLIVAQHYRLPTRLLDWTRNPLTAAYFAVEKECDCESAIYVLKGYDVFTKDGDRELWAKGPFKQTNVIKIACPHINMRVIAQESVFTLHPEPDQVFTEGTIDKLIIPLKLRKEFKQILYRYGVDRASLFPDSLESLTEHIKWMRTNLY